MVQEDLKIIYTELYELVINNPNKNDYFKNGKLFIGESVFYNQNGHIKFFQKGSVVCNDKLGDGKQYSVKSFNEESITVEGLGYKDFLKDDIEIGYENTWNMGGCNGALLSIHPELRKRQKESHDNPDVNSVITNMFIKAYTKNQ